MRMKRKKRNNRITVELGGFMHLHFALDIEIFKYHRIENTIIKLN